MYQPQASHGRRQNTGISWPLTKAFGSLRSAPPWPRPITFAAFAYRLGLLGDFPD
jgi:hypothetical protein